MKPVRNNIGILKEKAEAVNGNFLNSKDYEQARRIRPLMWIYNGQPVDSLTYLEGWINVPKSKSGKPVRFELDAQIPEDMDWKMSDGYMGKAPKPQVPDGAIALLHWDYKTESIKLSSFTQKTVIRTILSWLDKEIDGQENELYVENLADVDIIIQKGDKAYTVTHQPPKKDIDFNKILQGFTFSWEAFMKCEDPFAEDGEIVYEHDVAPIINKNTKQSTKSATKQEVEDDGAQWDESDNVEDENPDWWKEVLSPKGKKLGSMTDENLLSLYNFLDKSAKTDKNGNLFLAVKAGCEANNLIDIPF